MFIIEIVFVASLCLSYVLCEADARFGSPKSEFHPPPPELLLKSTSREFADDHLHCALLIPGLGKSSLHGHTLDVFNGIESKHVGDGFTCISFKSIDAAFIIARDIHGLPRPKKPITTPQIANLGRVLVETTRILAKQYDLPKDVIVNGLPLVDTLKTIIGTICHDFIEGSDCKVERYREYNGRCNNLENPHWGSAFSIFRRRIGPDYADGLQAPRISKGGYPLPSARAVSAHVHRDEGLHDHAITVMCIAWGQAIDHDLTLTGETKLYGTKEDPKCCEKDANFPECFPIKVSSKDAFYALFKQNCISVTRSAQGVPYGCKLGPRHAFTEISSYIDGNWVYGSKTAVSSRLRLFKGGLLKSLPVFREFGMKDLMPLKLEEPSDGCIRPNDDLFCFDAGDGRVNEQLVLAVVHTLMMREHNRIANELGHINPHWNDEKLYHETRHIIAAIIQHITYNEFLPMVLGKEVMTNMQIILEKRGYFEGYDPKTDVTITSDFITSAFRFGHSLLPSTVERWSPGHKYIGSQRLSEMLRQPYDLYKGGWCDQYMMGLCNQVGQAMDDAVTQEVTNHLFQEPNKKFGMDLAALNMQRGREHGVPSYNEFRHFCGLHPIRSWHELEGIMPNKTVKRYSDVYKHPDDIDLWSGGVSERPMSGAMVGPLFSCLIGLTFKELRYGDRFWYENGGYPSSFSPAQLEEIRKIKLSRIICDNSDDIKTTQVYVMVLPDHDINPRVPCKSGILPRMDLSKWRDHPGSSHSRPHHSPIPDYSDLNLVGIPDSVRELFLDPVDQNEQSPLTKPYSPSREPSIVSQLKPQKSPLDTRLLSQDFIKDYRRLNQNSHVETSSGFAEQDLSAPDHNFLSSSAHSFGENDFHDSSLHPPTSLHDRKRAATNPHSFQVSSSDDPRNDHNSRPSSHITFITNPHQGSNKMTISHPTVRDTKPFTRNDEA